MFLAAAVQMTSTSNERENVDKAETLIRRAAQYGASLIVTPENTNFLGPHDEKVRRAHPLDGRLVQKFGTLAAELSCTLIIGSFNEKAEDPTRCYNTSLVFGPDGRLLATYRKLHLFDVHVSSAVNFRESNTILAGDSTQVVQTPVASVGLSICYDLRFPELYRALVDQGANLLTIPAAFTLHTGKDHWQPLVRARAIETQCWVVAPGQWGEHPDQGLRQSWGHSMIVDPWGNIVAQASDGEGLALAEIQLDKVTAIRKAIPVANHRRL